MKKNKKIYEAPLLTVVEFRTERGFAFSSWAGENVANEINMMVALEVQAHANDGSGNLVAGEMNGQEDHSGDVSGEWSYANGSWF